MHMHRLVPKRYRGASTASNVYVASRGSSMCAAADSALPVCVLRRYGDRCVVTSVCWPPRVHESLSLSADAPRQVSRRRIWRMLARPDFVPLARPAFYSFISRCRRGLARTVARNGVAVVSARGTRQRSFDRRFRRANIYTGVILSGVIPGEQCGIQWPGRAANRHQIFTGRADSQDQSRITPLALSQAHESSARARRRRVGPPSTRSASACVQLRHP